MPKVEKGNAYTPSSTPSKLGDRRALLWLFVLFYFFEPCLNLPAASSRPGLGGLRGPDRYGTVAKRSRRVLSVIAILAAVDPPLDRETTLPLRTYCKLKVNAASRMKTRIYIGWGLKDFSESPFLYYLPCELEAKVP